MNTIKFSKINNRTTEQSDLQVQIITREYIINKEFEIYHPCNLNIFVTEQCQNNCYFCINGGFKKSSISDDEYLSKLDMCLSKLEGKPIEITITGGEPTLLPERLVGIMQLCKKYGFPCRTFSTTAYGMEKMVEGKPICQHMLENNFIHNINISRMHYDETKNYEIFKGNNISNEELSKLAKFFNINGAEMRVSCNIIPNYIDLMSELLNFIKHMKTLGVDTIMFRELIGKDSILLPDILDFTNFEYIETIKGLVYEVDIWFYKEWLVKHYKTKSNINQNILTSMSFKDGILRQGFDGKIIKVF